MRPEQPAARKDESIITMRSTVRTRICAMSESSLPPFGPAKLRIFLKTFRPGLYLKEALGRLRSRIRCAALSIQEADLETRATRVLREHLDVHAANLERAVRLGEKAERL